MRCSHWFMRLSVMAALVSVTVFCGGWKWEIFPPLGH
jgi:hypothetical protein